MGLYYQTNFTLSARGNNFIINLYKNFFQKNFEHDADYNTIRNVWKISPIFNELKLFLETYNIDLNKCFVNTFVSNTLQSTKTNPHVDVLNNGKLEPVKTRFNILIIGNPFDPMIWWDKFEFGNQIYKTRDFHVGNQTYKSLVVPGDSVDDRLKFLGSPSVVKHNLLTPSSFVNTFVAHALEISPGPRLVLSVGIDKEIDKIII
jgi:hypothetical protein